MKWPRILLFNNFCINIAAFGTNDLDTIKKLYQRKILMTAILAVHLLRKWGVVVYGKIKVHGSRPY